jgi:hypothetical protein
MKFNWILALLNFLTFSIVEGEGGGADDAPLETDATNQDADDTNADAIEAESPQDAVLEALELTDTTATKDETPGADSATDKVLTDEEKATAEAAKADEGKDKQAITDADLEPLNSKNPATNERFQKITEGFKAEKVRADSLNQEVERYKGSIDSLRQLGFTDETAANDLIEFSGFRHVLAAGDEKAFSEIIGNQIKQFEALHGKKITINASVLSDFPDLQQKVENLEIDEDTAHEVARARKLQERSTRENQQNRQNQEHVQNTQAVLNSAVSEVETLQANWLKTDPDFNAILPHLQPQLAEIGKTYPPHLWARTLEIQYKSLKKALVEQGAGKIAQPLRGNAHQSGKPAPSSASEAVLQELGLDA